MVINNESYFSSDLLREIIENSGKTQTTTDNPEILENKFTEKEIEILRYFAMGLTASEIAEKIFRSLKTVESHRSKLLEKSNTKNTINLVLYAIKNKLVEIT